MMLLNIEDLTPIAVGEPVASRYGLRIQAQPTYMRLTWRSTCETSPKCSLTYIKINVGVAAPMPMDRVSIIRNSFLYACFRTVQDA